MYCGFDEPGHEIQNVTFQNITIESDFDNPAKIALVLCQGLTFQNVSAVTP